MSNDFRTVSRNLTLITFVVAAAALFITPRAGAQGTFGTFADPVTSSELDIYAKRLNLSDEQYRTLLDAHDEYKKNFRQLREGAIEEFIQESREVQMSMRVPQRDVVKKIIGKAEKLNKKIASLDNSLFDSIVPMLTEQQHGLLPRIRQHRERRRYAGNRMPMAMTGGELVDLSELVLKMDLAEEKRKAIDPLLSQYERRLTSRFEELHKASMQMMLDMIDALEEAGLADLDFSDPAVMQERMEQIQAIWQDVFSGIRKKAMELAELNDKTYESLANVLGGTSGRDLRDRYIAKAYPQATFALDTHGPQFSVALELDDLDAEQREVIEAAATAHRQAMKQLLNETLETIREFRANQSIMNPGESWREQREKINKLQAKAQEKVQQAENALASTLNDEQQQRYATLARKRLQKRLEDGVGGFSAATSRQIAELAKQAAETAKKSENEKNAPSPEVSEARVVHSVGMDQYLPQGISRSKIHTYAQQLNLDEGEQAVVRELHRSYIKQLRKVKNTQVQAVHDASMAIASLWNQNDQSSQNVDASDVEKVGTLRREAFKAIAQADKAFFDDFDLILTTDAQRETLRQLRATRKRERLQQVSGSGWSGRMFGGNDQSGQVDLYSLIEQQDFDAEQKKQIQKIIDQHEDKLVDLLEKRYEAALDVNTAQQKWMIKQWAAQNSEDGNTSFDAMAYQESVMQWQQKAQQAAENIASLNEKILSEIRSKLGEDVTASLQRAYQEQAYPDIYQDQMGVSKTLQKALELNDLTQTQRSELQTLAGKYHDTFEKQAQQLLDLNRQAPQRTMDMNREDWQRFAEHRQAMQKIQFERRELAARTITEIKIILDEDQIERIGGLPEISKQQEVYVR